MTTENKLLYLESMDNDTYYYYSPCGLGDTLIMCSYFYNIKNYLGGKLIFVLKPTHAFIADEYGIEDYLIAQNPNALLYNLNIISQIPQKGKIYIAHPMYSDRPLFNSCMSYGTFLNFYKKFFKTDEIIYSKKMELKNFYPSQSFIADIENKLNLKLSNSILYISECRSSPRLNAIQTDKLLNKIKSEYPDCTLITDQMLNISLYELISLALSVKHVYAVKSGICEVLAKLEDKLTAIYQVNSLFDFYSAKGIFGESNIIELKIDEL